MKRINVTALVIALREQEFIAKCLGAIYPFVTRIYVISNYDTNYYENRVEPDQTVRTVLDLYDPDRKIVLFVNRRILDETIQRNWGMASDTSLYRVSHMQFAPHAHELDKIRYLTPRTDWFWVIDADEIYDPETIPGMLDFVSRTKWNAVLVRGHNFFKKWNYRISLENNHFWQIGFLRPGRFFFSRRRLYIPRPLGWVYHLSAQLFDRLSNLYLRQTRLPEQIAHFYHGAYVGDDVRIWRKLKSSSHATELAEKGADEWFERVWKQWNPRMTNFGFPPDPSSWASMDHIPTSQLPDIIRDSDWPEGWIERDED